MPPSARFTADAPHMEVSKVARAKSMIKKPWTAIKSKLKSNHHTKQSIEVASPPRTEVEINLASKDLVGLAPAPQEAAPFVDLPASGDSRTSVHSIHTKPQCSGFPSFPGLRMLNVSLAPPVPEQVTVKGSRSSSLPDPTPEVIRQSEIAPGRQESGSDDTIGSDEAVFGCAQNATNDTVMIVLYQPQNSLPAEAQIAPAQAQFPLMNQIERKMEVPKLSIPGLAPAPTNGTHCVVQHPAILSPPLTPSSQIKIWGLQNAQQRIPVILANLAVSPGPTVVAQTPGTPPSVIPTIRTAPDTPAIPPTPIKHQGGNPGAIRKAPDVIANQIPAPLPRSPIKLSPLDSEPVTVGGGKNFGVIGDRRPSKNQPQSQAVGEPKDEGNMPLVKVEPLPVSDRTNGKRDPDDSPEPEPIKYSEPVYVGRGRYFVGRYLGGGAMGKVYSVANRESMALAALKVIKRKNLDSTDYSLIRGEWSILKAIGEAKFVNGEGIQGLQFLHGLLESWYDRDHIYFAMPLCVGSLRTHLKMARFDSSTIRVYAAELMHGLEALHHMKIIHFDLKPENVLVCPDGHLSITDFGFSFSWLDPRFKNRSSHVFRSRRLGGTDGYMAPEIITAMQDQDGGYHRRFGFAIDIWSMGVVIAELGLGGDRLVSFENEEEAERWKDDYRGFAHHMVLSPKQLMDRVWKRLETDHAMLVERMLKPDEASRPHFDEIFSHPFFSDLESDRVLRRDYSVPIPPFESVLPCWHKCVEDIWFSGDRPAGEQDGDQYVIPEDFVWDVQKAIRPVPTDVRVY